MKQYDLSVQIGDLLLKNPIMPASGTFGVEMAELFDFNKLGALVPKSVTKYPRGGNDTPRVCEVQGGMINSIGIQSKGLDYYMKNIIPTYTDFDVPFIASISADSTDEFAEMAEMLSSNSTVAALELNISCPNLKGDGKAFGMDADISYELVQKVRNVTKLPIITKLTPNVTNIQQIARACEEAGSDSLIVANTLLALAIDIHTKRAKIGNGMGGLSGPLVKPIIVRMIYQVSEVCSIPIIGCGGVMSAEDAIEMILAGASAIQVGTANFINPYVMLEIIDGIKEYMKQYNYTTISQFRGIAHDHPNT